MSDIDNTDRTWRYYKHADDLQHRRHQLFLTIEGILLAGFVGSQVASLPKLRVSIILGIIGIIAALVWVTLAETVQRGMDYLNDELKRSDSVYERYLQIVRRQRWASGRWVMNIWVPVLVIIAWAFSANRGA